ncbi:MAG: N-acyl amino acid synthase FeeM domain-containing protein [Planctomycetaceae bacterium]
MSSEALIDAPDSPQTFDGRFDQITYRIAGTRSERMDAFQLVYERYLAAELIHPNEFGIRVTPYHLLPTTNVFIAASRGRTICTVTLIGDSHLGLPMECIYSDEVDERRHQGLYVGEVSCLAFEAMPLNHFLLVFMQLTRLMAQHARRYGMHQFLITVRPQHARFYQRFMGFEQIGQLMAYPVVRDTPAVACCLDFAAIDQFRPKCYSAYFGTRLSPSELVARPMSPEELRFFQPIADQYDCSLPELAFD